MFLASRLHEDYDGIGAGSLIFSRGGQLGTMCHLNRYQIIRANHRSYFAPAVCKALFSRSLQTIYGSNIKQVKGCHKASLIAKWFILIQRRETALHAGMLSKGFIEKVPTDEQKWDTGESWGPFSTSTGGEQINQFDWSINLQTVEH